MPEPKKVSKQTSGLYPLEVFTLRSHPPPSSLLSIVLLVLCCLLSCQFSAVYCPQFSAVYCPASSLLPLHLCQLSRDPQIPKTVIQRSSNPEDSSTLHNLFCMIVSLNPFSQPYFYCSNCVHNRKKVGYSHVGKKLTISFLELI